MKKILIMGEYPTENNIKDGMIRRIFEIDKKLVNYEKVYLEISFFRKINSVSRNVYKLNFFLNFLQIINIIKENNLLYIHSLHNYIKIWLILFFIKKDIIVDFHGVVPEEAAYKKQYKRFLLYSFIEKNMIKKISKMIFVTKSMQLYYENKYPEIKNKKCLNYPILDTQISLTKEQLKNIPNDKIICIYSGGINKWQNIDLMLDIILNNLSDKVFYIILTGQKKEIQEKLIEKKISEDFYLLDSVLPNELSKYYKVANYGFILRDDHILNRVANPTKLGEYLEYGIIPIVKLEDIGDYKNMGYEYITVDKFSDELPKIKSQKNIEIMKKYRESSEKIDFLKFIEE